MHVFSFRDFEDEVGLQDVISLYFLDQFSILITPRMQKCVKKGKKSIYALILESRYFDLSRKSKGEYPSQRTIDSIAKLGVTVGSTVESRSMAEMMHHFDQNCTIKSRPFDRRWSVRMRPRRA